MDKSFAREGNTIGRIKHKRLVKLLGYCINRGAGSNLLIYEYMENGNVYDWLHQELENIKKRNSHDWETRYKIVDIKSANILLDVNMDAHLGHFLLAKAIIGNLDSLTSNYNMWFVESYGYIAPARKDVEDC
nr:LRR receptor-like serine/threonine-protein kinase GSO1 [Tanacetum cinerariifolium]